MFPFRQGREVAVNGWAECARSHLARGERRESLGEVGWQAMAPARA
jgi:hypothetical protein